MELRRLGREAELAAEAVRDAVSFMRNIQATANTGSLTKTDTSPVTVADFVLQAFLVSRLAHHFGDDPVVAEEDAAALRAPDAERVRLRVVELVRQTLPGLEPEPGQVLEWIDRGSGACGRRFWTLDPIDGTKGLLRGGQYAVALALVVDGRVQVAALGCPRLTMTAGPSSPVSSGDSPGRAVMTLLGDNAEGGVAVAVRDRGAWWLPLNSSRLIRLSASTETNPTRARALQSFERGHDNSAQLDRTLQGLSIQSAPILMDSQAKHVLLAAGGAELLLRFPPDPAHREAIWDQAPGSLLIAEAGGRVTDIEGRSLDFTTGRRLQRNTGLLASNGALHQTVLDVIRPGCS